MKKGLSWGIIAVCIASFSAHLLYKVHSGFPIMLGNDVGRQLIPFLTFFKQSILSGSLPLWNPYQACGSPFFAIISLGFFYPVNWIALLTDATDAILLIQVFHIMVGLGGMALCLRQMELGWPATTIGAFLFGYAVLTQSLVGFASTYAWLPTIFWLSQRLFRAPSFGSCLSLTICLTLSFLGGFIQYFYYISILLWVYFLVMSIASDSRSLSKDILPRFKFLALAFLLMVGLVSVQLLPSFELSELSVRNTIGASVETVDPFAIRAGIMAMDVVFTESPVRIYNNYFGLALFILPFAFASKRTARTAIALAATLGYLILFILSKEIPALALFGKIPLADSFRLHGVRMLPIIQFVIIVLACMGLESLWEKSSSENTAAANERSWMFWMFAGAYSVLVCCGFYLLSGVSPGEISKHAALVVGFLAGVSAFALFAARFSPWIRKTGIWLIAFLLIFDTAANMYFLPPNPYTGIDIDTPPTKQALAWVKENADIDRVLLHMPKPNPNFASMLGFHSINSYNSFTLTRWNDYARIVMGPEVFDRITYMWPFYGRIGDINRGLFLRRTELCGVASLKYFISYRPIQESLRDPAESWELNYVSGTEPKFCVYENRSALPRAYLVNSYITTGDDRESAKSLLDNQLALSHSVILENGKPSFASGTAPSAAGRARVVEYEINEVTIEVETETESLLVLTDSYYPGWKAFIDDNQTPIWRANSLFRAVEVPPGRHIVAFQYRPASLIWGSVVSAVTLLSILAGVYIRRISRRRSDS